MNNQNSSLAKEIEDLINKSIEANKSFLNESSKLVRNFTTRGEKKTLQVPDSKFLTEAFTAYAKLNIQYMNNVLDLGVSLIKQANERQQTTGEENVETNEKQEPAFTLKGEVEPGNKISLSFLLDNVKEEPALCNLHNTHYNLQSDPSIRENFTTNFSPQSFTLNPGEQKRINIDISVPINTKVGLYSSDVHVKGFEPSYFSVLLTVRETSNKTADDAGKKTKKSEK